MVRHSNEICYAISFYMMHKRQYYIILKSVNKITFTIKKQYYNQICVKKLYIMCKKMGTVQYEVLCMIFD